MIIAQSSFDTRLVSQTCLVFSSLVIKLLEPYECECVETGAWQKSEIQT